MLRIELHSHTADDPVDRIPYTTRALIDRAAALGYQALAVTLHERQLDVRPLAGHAAARGITLIPGIERTIEGCHVLLLNFSPTCEDVSSFDDLARLRERERGLVVAPHPFYPLGTALGKDLERHAELFDAVEQNAMYTATLDFNRKARRWALARGKPLVGNGDVHRLEQLGSTYSLVEAEPDPAAICEAIRQGRVEVRSRPLSWVTATAVMASLMAADVAARLQPASRAGAVPAGPAVPRD
jgi:hypothetical protein